MLFRSWLRAPIVNASIGKRVRARGTRVTFVERSPFDRSRAPSEAPPIGDSASCETSRVKLILTDFVKKLPAANAELLGGLCAVAAAGREGPLNGPALDLGQ